jgi:TRAP-type C4-dicarboxylate transport system permease small subunit
MLIIVVDVAGRTFFNRPLTGAPELVKVSLVALVFLEITHTLREGRHVRSTIILGRVSPRVRSILLILADLSGMVLFILLCYSSWHLTVQAWEVLEYEGEGALRVPTYPVRTIILFCSGLMVVQYCMDLIKDTKNLLFKAQKTDVY